MQSVLAAEFAILVHLKSVRIVLLVFGCVIISLLALGADQSNFDSCVISHSLVPPMLKLRLRPCADKGLPRTSLRDGSLSLAPDKGITKKPIHRGINIVSYSDFNVNSFLKIFGVFLGVCDCGRPNSYSVHKYLQIPVVIWMKIKYNRGDSRKRGWTCVRLYSRGSTRIEGSGRPDV